jgi:hypothetical protein
MPSTRFDPDFIPCAFKHTTLQIPTPLVISMSRDAPMNLATVSIESNPVDLKFRYRARRSNRRGVQILEALLVIPILLISLAAFFQFGPMVTVQQAVTQASIETAREISKIYEFDISDPGDQAEAVEVVNTILGVHGIQVGDPGLLVILEDFNGVACLGDAALETTYCPASSTVTDGAEFKVTLILSLENAPVPNVLGAYCVDLSNRHYQVTSVSRNNCLSTQTP